MFPFINISKSKDGIQKSWCIQKEWLRLIVGYCKKDIKYFVDVGFFFVLRISFVTITLIYIFFYITSYIASQIVLSYHVKVEIFEQFAQIGCIFVGSFSIFLCVTKIDIIDDKNLSSTFFLYLVHVLKKTSGKYVWE